MRGTGKVSLDECIRVIRDIAGDCAHAQCGCLVDIRDLDFYPAVSELREIAFEFIRLRAAFRCGTSFIVKSDRHYALGRFLAALVETAGLHMGVFRDAAEAEFWLLNHTGTFTTSSTEPV